jgi:hypothetical protein
LTSLISEPFCLHMSFLCRLQIEGRDIFDVS